MSSFDITSVEQIRIEPGTEMYYDRSADFFMAEGYSMCKEWNYERDPHGYCHQRSVLVGLLREIARLRDAVSAPS